MCKLFLGIRWYYYWMLWECFPSLRTAAAYTRLLCCSFGCISEVCTFFCWSCFAFVYNKLLDLRFLFPGIGLSLVSEYLCSDFDGLWLHACERERKRACGVVSVVSCSLWCFAFVGNFPSAPDWSPNCRTQNQGTRGKKKFWFRWSEEEKPNEIMGLRKGNLRTHFKRRSQFEPLASTLMDGPLLHNVPNHSELESLVMETTAGDVKLCILKLDGSCFGTQSSLSLSFPPYPLCNLGSKHAFGSIRYQNQISSRMSTYWCMWVCVLEQWYPRCKLSTTHWFLSCPWF